MRESEDRCCLGMLLPLRIMVGDKYCHFPPRLPKRHMCFAWCCSSAWRNRSFYVIPHQPSALTYGLPGAISCMIMISSCICCVFGAFCQVRSGHISESTRQNLFSAYQPKRTWLGFILWTHSCFLLYTPCLSHHCPAAEPQIVELLLYSFVPRYMPESSPLTTQHEDRPGTIFFVATILSRWHSKLVLTMSESPKKDKCSPVFLM